MQKARIKILNNLKEAQTMPLMNTVKTPEVNKVTPAPPAAPAAPAPMTEKPKSNVIEPPKSENTVPTTPVVENNQPQQQPQQEEEENKEAGNIYNLVKDAIDKKLNIKYYYENLSFEDVNYIKNKTFAVVDSNGIMKFAKVNKESLINNKIVSIYEPVIANTNNFIIDFFDDNIGNIVDVKNKLYSFGIDSNIYKFSNKYELRCFSYENINLNIILPYVESITNGMNVNLNSMKVGKMKRLSFSLDKNGNEGTLIRIG